jgi:hypothetical protein
MAEEGPAPLTPSSDKNQRARRLDWTCRSRQNVIAALKVSVASTYERYDTRSGRRYASG